METKKIKKIVIIVLILFVFVGLFIGFAILGCSGNPIRKIEAISGMTLPEGMEEEYYYYSKDFNGSYRLYAVFKVKEEPEQFLNDNSFEDMTTPLTRPEKSKTADGYRIPEEHHSNLSGGYYEWRMLTPSGGVASSYYYCETMRLIFIIVQG